MTRERLLGFLGEVTRKGDISAWRLTAEDRAQAELYYVGTRVECRRTVQRAVYRVEVQKDHGDGEQGYAVMRLPPGTPSLREALSDLVSMARSRNRPWPFPGSADRAPDDHLCADPRIVDAPSAATELIGQRWVELCAAHANDEITPGHLEVIAGRTDVSVETSQGLSVRAGNTDVYVEGTLTTREHERFFQQGAAFAGGIDLSSLIAQASSELLLFPQGKPAETGRTRLILRRGAIAQLFRAAAFDLLSSSVHKGISTVKLGDRFGPSGVSLWANSPVMGLPRTALDEEGEPVRPYPIVLDGRVVALAASRKYAALTGHPWTGGMTSLKVEGGTLAEAEILGHAASSGEPVLEVVEFANLEPDNESKAFGAEVRFGYLHRGGERIPVRGGSVSGNVIEALSGAQLSRAAGIDFGHPGLDEIPCHAPDLALLPPTAYAGR